MTLRLLNMEDGVAFDRKACDALLDTYRSLLFGHVGQEDAIAAASLRILTDHWPSIVRASYISVTQFRAQPSGESCRGGSSGRRQRKLFGDNNPPSRGEISSHAIVLCAEPGFLLNLAC